MEFDNSFEVPLPPEQAWPVLMNVQGIAPCMPGAQLQEIEGDIYRGTVKVKLGPISTAFKGQATFVERDDVNHRAVLKGEGKNKLDDLATKVNAINLEVVIAIGHTDFGQVQGDFNTLNALVTLAHDCRRPDLFQPQILAAVALAALCGLAAGTLPAGLAAAGLVRLDFCSCRMRWPVAIASAR